MSALFPGTMNGKNIGAFNKTYSFRQEKGLSYGFRILKSLAQTFQVRL